MSDGSRRRLFVFALSATVFSVLHHTDHLIRGNHSGWPFQAEVTPSTFSLLIYVLILLAIYMTLRGRDVAGYHLSVAVVGLVLIDTVYFASTGAPIHDIYMAYGSPVAGTPALVVLAGLMTSVALLASPPTGRSGRGEESSGSNLFGWEGSMAWVTDGGYGTCVDPPGSFSQQTERSFQMADVIPGRFTARIDESFVVFMIGMRVNRPLALRKWVPTARAMGPMLRELYANPQKGFLGAETFMYWPGVALIQYWRSFEDLERFARSPDDPHLPAWQRFNRVVKSEGSVGIWHESYLVEAGHYETIYNNMPVFGLAKATEHVRAIGGRETARRRLGGQNEPVVPSPE